MNTPNTEPGGAAIPRPTANCDQEAWLIDRLETVVRMALRLGSEKHVRADEHLLEGALDGLINGAAVEVIQTLGMEPEFVNLRRPARITDGLRGKPFIHTRREATPNDPKLSERGARRAACAAGSAGSRQRDARNGSLQRMVSRCGDWNGGVE